MEEDGQPYARHQMTSSRIIPVFDGHNDSLTADGHETLCTGKSGGHLDLPRMRAGGVRAAMFAAFTSSKGDYRATVARDDGVLEFQPAPPSRMHTRRG